MTRILRYIGTAMVVMLVAVSATEAQQSLYRIRLQDAFSHILSIDGPTTGFTTNWTLRYPSSGTSLGSLLYTSDASGQLAWLAPTTNGYILTLSGGIPVWTNPATVLGTSYWSTIGNSGTTPGVGAGQNYFGTSDGKNLIFATAATERMRILSTGNIAINTVTAPQLLTIGGDIGIVGVGSKVTASGTANELILEETTDTYGTSRLRMQNRNGSNGALFEMIPNAANTGTDLVDFGFKPGAKVQSNIRLEARTNSLRGTPNVTSATGEEFQFLFGSTTTPQYILSIGQSATLLESGNFGIGYSAPFGTFPVATPLEMLDVHTGNIILSNNGTSGVSGTAGILKFQGTRDGISSFAAGAQASNTFNYTLPTGIPAAGQVLSANTVSGATPYAVALSWATPLTIPITNTTNTTTTLLSLTNSSTTTGVAGNFAITSSTNTSTAVTASTAGTAGTAFSATASGNGGASGHLYGVLGIATDATQGGNTNAGTGVRSEGNSTTTDANSNIALQIVNGEFVVGRQAASALNSNASGTNILAEDDANTLTDQGPSGVIDITTTNPGNNTSTTNTLVVDNRYAKSTSIVLLTVMNGGTASASNIEDQVARITARGAGTFTIELKRSNPGNVGTAGTAGTVRVGFLIVNPGK